MHEAQVAQARATKARAFALELTKGCNLRCGYCYYADRPNAYDPKTRMSREVAEGAVDLLLAEALPGEAAHLHFFGGEPLLEFPLLVSTVVYGERRAEGLGKRITFEVTTNGTRLEPEVITFLNEHRIRVGISFDGPPQIQDVARPLAHGSSYALAAPKIQRLLASRAGTDLEERTHCSVVLTRADFDLVGITRHLEGLGFKKILMTPATDLTGRSHGFRDEDLPRLEAAFDVLAAEYERAMDEGRHVATTWFPRLMERLLSGERRMHFCRGGLDYLGVSADGGVSLCYRFFEEPRYAMGSVQEGIERGVTERLLAHPFDERTACSRCWARYFCGGSCHHDNLTSMGAIDDPNPVACDIFRHSMGRILETWARLSRTGRLPRREPPVAPTAEDGAIVDETRPARTADVHARDLGGEHVLYHPTSHEVVVLNETAAFVYGLCDGRRSVADLLRALEERYDAPAERLRNDLLTVLRDLRSRHLVSG